jgi:hypothetical protein
MGKVIQTLLIVMAVVTTTVFAKNALAVSRGVTITCPALMQAAQMAPIQISADLRSASIGNFVIPYRTDGDCQGKAVQGLVCFQNGQFMLNVPAALATGRVKSAKVWVNSDVDDEDGNGRKGPSYECTAN